MISPIENNNMVVRAQDYSTVRQNELTHAETTHVVIAKEIERKEDSIAHSVTKKDNSDKSDTHHDAKEEGRNKYFSQRKTKKGNESLDEGVVVKKSPGGFNITV